MLNWVNKPYGFKHFNLACELLCFMSLGIECLIVYLEPPIASRVSSMTNKIAVSQDTCLFNFNRWCQNYFPVFVPAHTLTYKIKMFLLIPFLSRPAIIRIVHFCYVGKSKRHLIMLLSWIFQRTLKLSISLYINIGHLNFLFCEMPIQSLCHFLLEFLLVCSKYVWVIFISWQILDQLIHLQYLFPFYFFFS